jgi:hypothetical protein
MLHQSGMFGSPIKPTRYTQDLSIIQDDESVGNSTDILSVIFSCNFQGLSSISGDYEDATQHSMPSSPLETQVKRKMKQALDSDDDYVPLKSAATIGKGKKTTITAGSSQKSSRSQNVPAKKEDSRVSHLEAAVNQISIGDKELKDEDADSDFEPSLTKKKKRYCLSDRSNVALDTHSKLIPLHRILGNKPIITEEQIEQASFEMQQDARSGAGQAIRRSTGRH